MKRRAFMGCLLACVLMMAQIAVADQVTLQASKDNTLFEDDNGALSNGKGIHMFVGKVGAAGNLKKRRGVIAFNFAGIPAGATIDRVILTLNMSRTIQPMARTVMLHRLSKDWGEGTSNAGLTQDGDGAPSTPNDATWVHTFFDTGSWGIGILGGDFSSTASASRDIGVIGSYTWDSNSPGNGNAGMRNDVQAWLDGTAGNFGWLLLQGDETSPASVASVKQFDTREAADPTIRPKLEVFYTPNRPPVAVTQSVTTAEDTLVGVTLTGSDVDGDTLTFAIVTGPANGVLSGTPPTLTYTPAANFNSTDSFTFRVSDGIVTSPPATVTVTVTSVNDPPLANDDAAGTLVNTAVTINVLSNDNDIDNDTLSVSAVTQGANGTVINTTANVTYTPNANFAGTDTFTYTLSDGKGGTATATVTIKVSAAPNAKPVAMNDAQRTPAGTAVTIDVLRNDSDADGDPLTITSVTQGSNGTVVNNKINVTYTPRANFGGTDTFTYTLSDGIDTVTATVTVTIFTIQRQLTVTKTGAGDGTVTSSPPGIACGATCSAQYDNGTSVTLTAITNANAVFSGWSGGGCSGTSTCTVSMTQDRTVTATFAQNLPPRANAGPDQEVDESLEGLPVLVTLDGSASTDPDGSIASYLWTQTAGPPVVLDDATIARPRFTAPVVGALDAFAPGDHVPGFVLSPSPGGVAPEIQAHGTYANGQWTIMLTRPLRTPDTDGDVQFDFTNPANTYPFSIAYLDNTGAAPPLSAAAAVMFTQDTRAYTLGNATSRADLRAVQETPQDCSAFTGTPLQTRPTNPAVVPALTLRAAYDSAKVYLCVEAPDPNRQADEEKELWEFVGPEPTDWQRLPGSDNVMGGRVGAFDEDRLALWWNINAQDFATQGCAALCHDARMRSRNADGRADLWYWKAARTNPVGFAEDQGLDPDRTRCPDTPCRQLDANTLPIARANSRSFDAVTLPAYVAHAAPGADVRFLIDGAVPSQCPGETCAPAVPAALSDDPLTFELTVTDNLGLKSAPDSVTITIRDVDRDEDSDGVIDTVENGAPNNGDGNSDGIPDILQPHVTSLPNTGNRGYITLVAPQGTTLAQVRFLPNPPAGVPPDLRFPLGFLTFTVLDVPPGGRVTVTLLPPPNTVLAADAFYVKFGPTPETPGDHFYRFTFDGTTGAEILPDRIQLHLVDGARGDHDLTANGQITDPGAVAIAAPPLPAGEKNSGGGGCSILPGSQRTHSRPGDALGNIVLPVLALLILYGWGRVSARPTLQRFFRAASRSKPPGGDDSGRAAHDIFLTKEADND